MKKNPKEVIDISTLPQVTMATSSLLLDFKNNDRRLKLIEAMFKMPDKILKLLSREHIMDYAKENKIYVDPLEGKKPNPKDPPVERKEITPEELAKAAVGLINDSSVQYRKDKKALLDSIEALKKQKEEATAYWENPPPQDPKKKPDKKAPPQPNDIIIPVIDEMDTEYLVVLYNYPLNEKEYAALEKEGLVLNSVNLLTEVEDVIEEPKPEAVADPKAKKAPAQKADASKAVTDNAILKYFAIPTIPDYSPQNIFDILYKGKLNSDKTSKMRSTLFDKSDFAFRQSSDPKKTYFNIYQDEFVEKMKQVNRFYLLYRQWVDTHHFQELGTDTHIFTTENVEELLRQSDFEPKDYEHLSIGNILVSFFGHYLRENEEEEKPIVEEPKEEIKEEPPKEEIKEEPKKEEPPKKVEPAKPGKKVDPKAVVPEPEIKEPTPEELEAEEEDTKATNEINQIFEEINLELDDEYHPKIPIPQEMNQGEENQNVFDIHTSNILSSKNILSNDNMENMSITENVQNTNENNNIHVEDTTQKQNESINIAKEIEKDNQKEEAKKKEEEAKKKEEEEKANEEKKEEPVLNKSKEEEKKESPLLQSKDISMKEPINQSNNLLENLSTVSHNTTVNLDYERLVINENDDFMKNSIETKNETEYIYEIEKGFNNFRNIPGLCRPIDIYPIEENLRKAERSKVYPFLPEDITIPIYEKYELLVKFEEGMKNTFPDREFDFGNRIYQENLNKDILCQKITRLLMLNPEVKTVYNESTDNMLLMLYYQCPKERVYRKLNKYKYLSKPDFENWVKYFRPIFIKLNEKKKQAESTEGENPEVKKEDGQPIPDTKDTKPIQPAVSSNPTPNAISPQPQESATAEVQNPDTNSPANIQRKQTNKLFGELQSIFDGNMYIANDTCIREIKEKIKYMFPADNGIFIKKVIENGIFSSFSSFVYKDDLIFGIRKNDDESKEFWYHYPNNTCLTVDYLNNETFVNFALPNGLNVQILPKGEIAQKLINNPNHRIITSKASIINCFEDGSRHILYSNGNFCSIANGKAINTNNKGFRIEKDLSTGELTPLDPIPITIQSDTDSQTKTLIREDGVITIKYPDNTSLTIHNDHTKIYTYAQDTNGNVQYILEHNDFATVNVFVSGEKRIYENKPIITELAQKSIDGIVYQVLLPDKNEIYVIKEKVEEEIKTKVIIYNVIGGLFKVEKGDVEVVSPSELRKLEEEGADKIKEQLNARPVERKEGIYTCDLVEGKIFTIDGEKNLFEIYDDGYANCVLAKKEEEEGKIVEENVDNENKEDEEKKEEEAKEGNPIPEGEQLNENKEGEEEKKEEEKLEAVEIKKLLRPPSPDYERLYEEKPIEPPKPKVIENNDTANPTNQNSALQSNTNLNAKRQVSSAISKQTGKSDAKNSKKQPSQSQLPQVNPNQPQSKQPVPLSKNAIPQPNNQADIPENQEIPPENLEPVIVPPTTNFIIPRLFVIESDSSGYELLTEEQVTNFKKIKEKDSQHVKYIKEEITPDFTGHYYITKYFSIKEGIQETHYINQIMIPDKLEKFAKLPKEPEYPQQEIYFYRNFIESRGFNNEFREKVAKAKEDSFQYFEKKKTEWFFGTYRDKEVFKNEMEEYRKLTKEILQKRQIPDVKFDYDKIRKKIKINHGFIQLLPNESVLFNIQDYVDLKESKKIREDLAFRIYPLNLNLISANEMRTIVSEYENKNEGLSASMMNRKKTLLEGNTKEAKFFRNYFDSEKGIQFLQEHPHKSYVKKVNQDPQEQLAQNLLSKASDEQQMEEEKNTNNINLENNIDVNNKQSSPVVYLNEDGTQNMQGSQGYTSDQLGKSMKKKRQLPSIYKQTQILNKVNEEYNAQKAREWHEAKTMKFTYDGELRKENPLIPKYLKPTFPQAEFNEDYIYIEKLTERRVKTSSVANRIYFNAPSVEEIRKSGQHDLLLEAMENRRTPEEMMERLNLMITSELCDPLNKQLKIDPVSLDFGIVCEGKMYQMYFKLRNDDNMTNRVQVRKNMENPNIMIENFIGGKVVPGETKKVKIVINTKDMLGKYSDTVEVQTKSFIYKIPIKALIVKEEEYDKTKYAKEGRELYSKSYPAGDNKYKCDPIKLVLPKIRELEEVERNKKLLEKNKEKETLTGGNEESEVYNGDGNKLPPV